MNHKITDISNLSLKAIVCGHQHIATNLRKEAAKESGDNKWLLKHRKRQLGVRTREYLIAYGLARGVSYQKLENRCANKNEPNAHQITTIIQQHFGRAEWTLTKVTDLLRRKEG